METTTLTKAQLERYQIFYIAWTHYKAAGLVKKPFEQWITKESTAFILQAE